MHGSRLNMAEVEIAIISRACLRRRPGDRAALDSGFALHVVRMLLEPLQYGAIACLGIGFGPGPVDDLGGKTYIARR